MIKTKVYILSLCLKKIKRDHACGPVHEFHFKGFYQGKRVERLIVFGGEFKKGHEYLIKAQVIMFQDGALSCRADRFRSIF